MPLQEFMLIWLTSTGTPPQSAAKSSSWGISIQHLQIDSKLVRQSFRVSQAGEAIQNHAQHQALQYPMHTPSRFGRQGIKGQLPTYG